MKKGTAFLMLAGLLCALVGTSAFADNESNCGAAEKLYLFSGTDAGVVRRGLNPGTAGCTTANSSRVDYVDTNILVPGATHVIASISPRPQTSPPGAATFKHQDGSTVAIAWHWVSSSTDPQTDRWESQSIALKAGTGTVRLTLGTAFVTYEKVN